MSGKVTRYPFNGRISASRKSDLLFAKNRESLFCGRRIRGSFGQMGGLLHSLTQEELDPSPALYSLYLRTSITGSEMKGPRHRLGFLLKPKCRECIIIRSPLSRS